MKRLWVLGALSTAMLAAILAIIIGMYSVKTNAYTAELKVELGVMPASSLDSTSQPNRAAEWQCWDDGSLDPCHRKLEYIQALTDDDIWIAAGGYHAAGILHYDGTAWQEMDVPQKLPFGGGVKALQMLSPNYGWAVANNTWAPLYNHNAPWRWDGATWHEMEIGHNWDWLGLEDLDIVSINDVWVVGTVRRTRGINVWEGAIAHWDGTTWDTVVVSETLRAVSMVSSDFGWAMGTGGSIYHLDNMAWISVTSPVTEDLYSVVTFDDDLNNAWAVGDGGTILHYNGGNWSPVSSPVTENLRSMAMTSATHGWIVGQAGTILYFDGADWVTVTSPTSADLSSVSVVSTINAYAISVDGGLIHWNGGVWETLFPEPERRGLLDVVMLAPDDGWVAGEGGRLAHWDGSDWNPVSSSIAEDLNALDFLAADDGWAVGESGTILHFDGIDWITVTSPTGTSLNGVDVISSTEGWAVGSGGAILHYNDNNWNVFTSPTTITLHDVRMVSVDDGWAVGGGWDGGYTRVMLHWNGTAWIEDTTAPDYLGFYSDIAALASDDVYVTTLFDPGLIHWDGISWSETSTTQAVQTQGIYMYSTDEGWATGFLGTISHWDGQSWELLFDRTDGIAEVDALAPHEAWAICGEWSGGAILHYTAPAPAQDTLSVGESLAHIYPGHETRITVASGTRGFSDMFAINYKLRPNDQGDLRGIDHFFDITSEQSNLGTSLIVTVRFSDTLEYGVFPSTMNLYRLDSSGWVTDGIIIVNTQVDELVAIVTQLGSFGVMGNEGNRIFLPVVLHHQLSTLLADP